MGGGQGEIEKNQTEADFFLDGFPKQDNLVKLENARFAN